MVLASVSTWMLISTAAALILGLSLMIWSLRGDRSRGRRRCPTCWYYMQGVPGLRCPECGCEARRERELFRPRRRWRWAMLALLIALAAPGVLVYQQFRERGWYWLLPRYTTTSDTIFGGWRVRMLEARDPDDFEAGQLLRFTRQGRPDFTLEGWRLDIGEVSAADQHAPKIGLGEDITGDGVGDLIVSDYSGGAHCCTTYHILSLAPDAVSELQTIDTGNSGANFHDIDGDGLPEMITADNAFAYWNAPYVESPMPGVVLKWVDGRFQVAGDLMREPAPDDVTLASDAQAIREDPDWAARIAADPSAVPPADLWREMLNLIYAGHADLAWRFLNDAWPENRPGRMEFMVDFITQLGRSAYWEGVRAINVPKNSPGAGMAMP